MSILSMVEATLEAAKEHGGVAGLIAHDERGRGATIIPVGSCAPLAISVVDWHPSSVFSVLDGELRIVAVLATLPGNGALRRIVIGAEQAGLTPVVVEPVGSIMPAIMRRWKWSRSVKGVGASRVEEWRP